MDEIIFEFLKMVGLGIFCLGLLFWLAENEIKKFDRFKSKPTKKRGTHSPEVKRGWVEYQKERRK